jgi:hypothetical protein
VRARRLLALVVVTAGAGCIPNSAGSSVVRHPRIAVLPVESEAFPSLAKTVNDRLQGLKARGGDDYVLSKVTLEVVQLSIECVESTPACYAAVGRNLSVDRLLLSQVASAGVARKHAAPSVKLSFTVFDVDKGAAVRSADRVFPSVEEASAGVQGLLDEALAAPTATASQGGR